MHTAIANLLQKCYPYLIFNAFFPVTSCFHSCISCSTIHKSMTMLCTTVRAYRNQWQCSAQYSCANHRLINIKLRYFGRESCGNFLSWHGLFWVHLTKLGENLQSASDHHVCQYVYQNVFWLDERITGLRLFVIKRVFNRYLLAIYFQIK